MKLNNNDDSHNSGLNLLIYNMLLDIESHPTWVCGLKPAGYHRRDGNRPSHPTWVCGLKPDNPITSILFGSHTLRGCVDWNTRISCWILPVKWSHTLRGCVDWNINGPVFGNIEDGHTLRGNIWIGALFTRRSSLWKNCKHSASYVFLSRLLILLWLEKTRTSPNAYLLSVFFCCFT